MDLIAPYLAAGLKLISTGITVLDQLLIIGQSNFNNPLLADLVTQNKGIHLVDRL